MKHIFHTATEQFAVQILPSFNMFLWESKGVNYETDSKNLEDA